MCAPQAWIKSVISLGQEVPDPNLLEYYV